MPKVRLNYDGWLALPAAARRALGVDTGDQLEVEVVDGRIVLRPLKSAAAAESFADELPPPPVEPETAAAALLRHSCEARSWAAAQGGSGTADNGNVLPHASRLVVPRGRLQLRARHPAEDPRVLVVSIAAATSLAAMRSA